MVNLSGNAPGELAERIRDLPKAHLHVHFPRTIRPSTLHELAAREGVSLDGFYRFSTLAEFLQGRAIRNCVTHPDDVRRLCREMVEDEARDGVRYTEPMVQMHRYVPRFGSLEEAMRFVERHAQGLEFLKPLRPGAGPRAAYEFVRSGVPPLVDDRSLAPDANRILEWMATGELLKAAEGAAGRLA